MSDDRWNSVLVTLWQGSRTKQFLQVGNATPPLTALAILTAATTEGIGPRPEIDPVRVTPLPMLKEAA